jgi:hypothetical protein
MSDNPPLICIVPFFDYLLKDLGVNTFKRFAIGEKLDKVKTSFEDNQSKISVSKISDELYNCAEPFLNDSAVITAQELAYLIILFSILTAVTVIITIIIIITLKSTNKNLTIGLIIGICLSYIIIGWLLIHNSFNIINNSIKNTEETINNCILDAFNKLELLVLQDETALDNALCAYPITT